MMTKAKKKIVSILVAATLLSSMCVASVSAANTSSVYWSVTSSVVGWKNLGSTLKADSSPVFFKMTASNISSTVDVKVMGTNDGTSFGNCTMDKNGVPKNYARCSKGVNYSLHNSVHEDGYSRVALAVTTHKIESISGIWNPNSSGEYNEAEYH